MLSLTKEKQPDIFKVSNFKCWKKGVLSQEIHWEFSFFEKTDVKECGLLLSFADEFNIEISIINFLDTLGFDAKDDGYTYFRFIFSTYIKEEKVPAMLKVAYLRCSEIYGATLKAIEQAMITATKKAIKKGKFALINTIFNMRFYCDKRPTNAEFIFFVIERFLIARKYNHSMLFKFEKTAV
ncbi:MAG: sporulation initiation factor Spo0A C-terminal domain-containing protein [Firmicutes bacterium]|nr:sporulation initiation factor Spo0A C-terminal domain-containing protein [Bacillota bacterium]